ncbi:CoA transferase [Leucobacter sp. UT-8R-CII-1-4]|uniref:CoA transferase n=1 Tax=Leucobacter sp. UT-8R-CII-1-4 TaxID=3040075 RepID=UPI0024A8983E|nr:CoA transferase [Leucobacter sp. UT-8R-CII-1-4]MDI6024508.1 CoA transferase [Leucobacter sp. UT-8R-CII-1-4]
MGSESNEAVRYLQERLNLGETLGSDHSVLGPDVVMPSEFPVTALAASAVTIATGAAAELWAARNDCTVPAVTVHSVDASAAFRAEQLFEPDGWKLPPLWDPLAGNYRSKDGWIRLHTNYQHHRDAAALALGASDRETIAKVLSELTSDEAEAKVVAAGGAAAAMRTREQWLASAPGLAAMSASPLESHRRSEPHHDAAWLAREAPLPFSGLRVLDLTRVIAGPVCTKYLAAYGADVLRIDPPGFAEVGSLLPETTLGKRTVVLDLNVSEDREIFESLVIEADVIVSGLRADALANLGYSEKQLLALNPAVILAKLNAYGWEGPWQNRRGFDSLVQMSCGIAATATGGRTKIQHSFQPNPLPAQALDHGTGWLLGAAIASALLHQLRSKQPSTIRASLVGTAQLLYELQSRRARDEAPAPNVAVKLERSDTWWGRARRVAMPGIIEGLKPSWQQEVGPLGRHLPVWW